MQTEDAKTMNTPYGRDEQLTDSPGNTSRNNLHSKRSRSGERIEEWQQIFSLQQNRWKDQFDDLKARFQNNFKQNRDGSYRSVPKSRRIKSNFIIPNEYLPEEKQSVKKGLEGTKERLARDQKEARKILNRYITEDTQDSPQQSNSLQRSQNYEYSLPNIQKQPAQARSSSTVTPRNQNSNASNSTLHRRYQSQKDLNKQVEIGSRSLENSQSLGSIIYNKEDRKSAKLGNKVKLPTIKHKNLGHLQNQIAAAHNNSLQTNSQRNLLGGGVAGGSYEEQPFSQISTGVRSMIRDSSVQQMTTSMSNQDGGDYSMAETAEERVLQKSNTEAGPLQIIESNHDQNVSLAQYVENANHQQPHNTQSNEQLQAIGMHYLRNLSKKDQNYPIAKSVINFNININVKESNDLYNYATKEQSKSKQCANLTREASQNNQSQASPSRVSRKKILEPIKSSFKEDLASQSFDKTVKMEEQKLQIGQVSNFIDQEIENDVEKIKIKKSLSTIESQLVQSGMTLKEVVDQHLVELYEKANMTSQQQIQAKQRQKAHKSRRRFKNADRSLDFVKIVKCSAHLQPLIKFQAMLKERSKKRRQQKVAQKQARKLAGEDSESDEVVLDPMPHLKRQWPEFLDQEDSINHFIEQVKQLIYLGDQHRHRLASNLHGSEYNWHQEPEMYQSSSGESKYSNEDIDQKDHLSVGESTLVNAMKKYKTADKIVQMNAVEGNDDLSSHLVYYYQEMNNKGNIPKGFGMVHRSNKPNEMDTNQVQMTDAHASAISNSLGRARYVNKLILKNVGLTDDQGIKIIQNMDQQAVRHLDISNNPLLTKAFYRALSQVLADPSSALQRLEIEGNKVGDAIIHELCAAMSATKKIQYLNISKNKISDAGARDLAILINESSELRLLFLHYNRIMGFGGVELAEAIGKSRSLQVLDISFNAICSSGLYKRKVELTEEEEKLKLEEEKKKKKKKNSQPINLIEESKNPVANSFAQLFARGFSEPWSEAFAKNKSLIHIDLSHNHIDTTDVEIIAEGLKKNQQIMGIHFQGNEGEVNALGHIKAGKPLTISHTNSLARLQAKPKIKREQLEGQSEADLMTSDLNWLKRPAMQGGIVKNQETLELQLNSNCWVCEGWTEHHFVYKCGISDDNPNHDPFKPIKLHLDIDHFEGDLMMKTYEGEMVYEVYRMLPPGPHRYFFSCDGQVSIAKDHPITTKKQNKPKQQQLDTSKFSQIKEELLGISELKKAGKKPKVQKKKSSTGRQKEEILEELKPDYYEMDLPQVNYIGNVTQTTTIFSEEYINGMNCCPRPAPKGLGNRNKVRTPWDFNLSCFASYKSDTTRLLNQCFEMDWGRTKVNRIVKNEEERERFKTYFRSVYKWFREVYKFTSGSDAMGDLFCIGTNVFSTLIQEEIPTLIEGKFLKLSDLDMERISTNSNEQNSKNNPKNMLVRHNFLEVFMRLCDTKYLKNKAAGEDISTLTMAFKTMFDTELFPAFSQYDSNIWRKTVLWKEDIDFKLKQSLPQLKAVYQRYIGKNSMPGTAQFMSLTEFTDCVLASDCLSDNFGAKQIGNQYVVSMMTQADEIDKDKHLKMTFVEFIEAIVRVAEKCEIPHCVIDEFNWGDDEIDPEMRETYAQRDIIIKLEAFLLFLVKGSLPIHHYTKLIKSWEDHQNAGLYANDLETGNFLALNSRRV